MLGVNWFKKVKAGVFPGADKFLVFNDNDEFVKTFFVESSPDNLNEIESMGHYVEWIENSNEKPLSQIKLNKYQKDKFDNLFKGINIFAKDISELGICKIGELSIKLIKDDPIYLQPYRMSKNDREYLEKEIQEMLKYNIIRRSKSQWSSPVVLISRPGRSRRICIDYRELNKVTVNDNWPVPRINDLLDSLGGSVFFTQLDLASGYWQIRMNNKSIEKTAFSTPFGHYEFLKMPFGLKCAPAEFCRIMNRIFGNLTFVKVYFDDITIHSTDFETHINHIKCVLEILQQNNLKLKLSKCSWLCKETKILGHIISEGNIKLDPEKIECIKNRSPPRNIKEIQIFDL